MTAFVHKRQRKDNYTSCYPRSLKNQRRSLHPVGENLLWQYITLKSPDLKVRHMRYVVQRSLFSLLSDATIIPATVKTQLSLRIVPDQDLDTIVASLRDYLRTSFDLLQSPNSLQVNSFHDIDKNITLISPFQQDQHRAHSRLVAWKPWWLLVQMDGKRSSGGMGRRASTYSRRRGEFEKIISNFHELILGFSPFLPSRILKKNLLVMHSTFPWDKARWIKWFL